ncbi:ATP-binding protein [Patescibacteria group bacterium]|nr:ATP-binding protein [Patescibacteria group bacterium]MBU4142014.1 ATP-binding protein [Patescibacteria group bacterium]
MMDIKQLEDIALDQANAFGGKEQGLEREIDFKKFLKTKQIVVVSGVRRSGKSTLLRQISKKIDSFYYVNFDDERLINFKVEDFNNLLIVWKKQFSSKNILIDEIQNVFSWERFARRIHDEGYKIFITGSNAKLLSSELATHLTGRYFKLELYPFSFREVLNFYNVKFDHLTSDAKAEIFKTFDDYLKNGGFPEYLKHQEAEFIKRAYEDIVYKDIITRFGIRETKPFRQLANFLFANFAKEISYNSLKNILDIKSAVSVKNYIGFLEESYLLFELYKYDFSIKKQLAADKKIYVIDNGMRNNVAFYFSEDRGRLLENMVFLELRRRGREIYYYKDKNECDFIIQDKGKIIEAFQVSQEINRSNEKREIDGLIGAMEQFNLKTGILLTENMEEERKIGKRKIKIMPVWKWLLG